LDNKKIVELADNLHTEINSTKDEFIKKIDSKVEQINEKIDSSAHNDSSDLGIYNKHIDVFSKNFNRIKNTIEIQNTNISKLTIMYRVLVCIAVTYAIVVLVILFRLPDSRKETVKNSVANSPAITAVTSSTTTVEPSPSPSPTGETTKSSVDDYSKLSKDYKLAYIKAVNSNDRKDLDKFISVGSSFDKYITQKLCDAKDLKLELKYSKVEKVESKDENIYIYVVENLGVRKSDKDSFEYKDYKIKYTVKKSGDSYTFESQENL
jgi:hypothetical protein